MLGRDLLFQALKSEGIPYIFGNPGTTELPVIDGCAVHPEVKYVTALHEHIAVAMAMGYARASGKIGVANLHVGPGLAHGLSALYNAWRARIPILVTVGQHHTEFIVQEPILTANLVEMARPFTKWAHEVSNVAEWPLVLHRAMKEAVAPPAGPVMLSLPADIMLHPVDQPMAPITKVASRVRPDAGELERAVQILASAKNPIIVAGDGVGLSDAWPELVAVAESLNAPVYTEALSSLWNFPNAHPLWQGQLPNTPAAMRAAFAGVDVAFLCGFTSQAPLAYYDGAGPVIPAGVKLVYAHDNPWEIGKNYPGEVGLLGNVKAILAEMAELLPAPSRTFEPRQRPQAASGGDLTIDDVARIVGELMPENGVLVNEAVSNTAAFINAVNFPDPLSYWGGKGGGLAHSMPAALGIKMGSPQRAVINVVGDGTFLYYPQTLWTAAKYNIPVTYVVLNNRSYRILKLGMRGMGGPWSPQAQFPSSLDLDQPDVDFAAVAATFSVEGTRVTDAEGLRQALQAGLAKNGPYLVDVIIDQPESPGAR